MKKLNSAHTIGDIGKSQDAAPVNPKDTIDPMEHQVKVNKHRESNARNIKKPNYDLDDLSEPI